MWGCGCWIHDTPDASFDENPVLVRWHSARGSPGVKRIMVGSRERASERERESLEWRVAESGEDQSAGDDFIIRHATRLLR